MDKDSNNIERNNDSETRMTAFQRAMAEKDGAKAPSAPVSDVPSSPQRRQVREEQPREKVKPVPLTPPEMP